MKKVDVSAIKNLIAYEGEPALTLYIPTHRYPTPPSIQEDQTRFKNLVRQGCDELARHKAIDMSASHAKFPFFSHKWSRNGCDRALTWAT